MNGCAGVTTVDTQAMRVHENNVIYCVGGEGKREGHIFEPFVRSLCLSFEMVELHKKRMIRKQERPIVQKVQHFTKTQDKTCKTGCSGSTQKNNNVENIEISGGRGGGGAPCEVHALVFAQAALRSVC